MTRLRKLALGGFDDPDSVQIELDHHSDSDRRVLTARRLRLAGLINDSVHDVLMASCEQCEQARSEVLISRVSS